MFETYTAPNPYPSNTSVITQFVNAIFAIISSSTASSSQSIGEIILPAQGRGPSGSQAGAIRILSDQYNLFIETGSVKTFDGADLDSIEFTSVEKTKRYIIKFNGNGAQYQDSLAAFAQDAKTLKANIVGFNYRGVGNSTPKPTTYQDLVTDGIAQVQRVLDLGVPSTSILLDGHSLGGSVATMVAKHFHDKKLPVYLWNDRSFASLARAAAGIVTPDSISSIESTVATSSYVALETVQWNADVATAYNSIPEEYKGYMFVSKKSGNNKGDGVISNPASLHKGVKFFEQRNNISTGHKMVTLYDEPGHCVSRSELVEKDGSKNAQEIYEGFVRSHMP